MVGRYEGGFIENDHPNGRTSIIEQPLDPATVLALGFPCCTADAPKSSLQRYLFGIVRRPLDRAAIIKQGFPCCPTEAYEASHPHHHK
jgi:hypothetical protein